MSRAGVAALSLLALAAGPAAAHQADQFATSPRTLGLAGAGSALGDGGASAFSAPAALGLAERDEFRLYWIGGAVNLAEVEGVERIDADGNVIPREDLPPEMRLPEQAIAPHSLTVDLVKRLGPWAAAGAYVTFPMPFLFFHDSRDPWAPSSVRYRNRVAQSTGVVGASVRLPVRGLPGVGGVTRDSALQGGLFFGFSISILPKANIEIDLDLIGVDDGTSEPFIDVGLRDVDLVVRARWRPAFSLLLEGATLHPALAGSRLGVTWRLPVQADIDPIHLDVAVEGLGNLSPIFALVDRIQAEVWLGLVDFYEPHQVKVSLAHQAERFAVSLDLQWSDWSALVPSYGRVVEGPDGTGGSLILDLRGENDFSYTVVGRRTIDTDAVKDTLDVAFGGEVYLPSLPTWPGQEPLRATVRAGYRWQPSMLNPTDGPSALLDGGVHTAAVGFGVQGPSLPIFDGPLSVDWGLQVQRILGMALPKTDDGLAGLEGMPVVYSDGARWPGGWAVVTGLQIGTRF